MTMPREPQIADAAQVRAAIDKLTTPQLLRLERFARMKMKGLVSAPKGLSFEVMVGHAIGKVLSKERVWRPAQVDFYGFIKGIIRSEISHLYESAAPDSDYEVSVQVQVSAGEPSVDDPIDERIHGEQLHKKLQIYFKNDNICYDIVCLWIEGCTALEVCEELAITEKEYYAARRRITRNADRLEALFNE